MTGNHESARAWTLAIIGCIIAVLLGSGVLFLAGYQNPLGDQVLSLIGSVLIVGGICFGIASIIRLRDYNRLHPRKKRPETGRPWIIGIVLSSLLIVSGCVVLYFAGHIGRYGNPKVGFAGLLMVIIGIVGEWMCISLLREFNKYRRPRLQ